MTQSEPLESLTAKFLPPRQCETSFTIPLYFIQDIIIDFLNKKYMGLIGPFWKCFTKHMDILGPRRIQIGFEIK